MVRNFNDSSCSLFSPEHNTLSCNITLIALAIFVPPVKALDEALFEKARHARLEKEHAAEEAEFRLLYEETRKRVLAGDRSELRTCVAYCEAMDRRATLAEGERSLRLESAIRLMQVAGATPETDDVVPLVVATTVLARQDRNLDDDIIRAGFALTQREDFYTLVKLYTHGAANWFYPVVSDVYGHHLALRVIAEPKLRAAFDADCVQTLIINYRMSDITFIGPNAGSACDTARKVLVSRGLVPKEN